LQTSKFYLAGSKKSRKSGFLRAIDRKNPHFEQALRACLRSRILALKTPKFYLAGSKKSRKCGFLRAIDRKNPHFKQALRKLSFVSPQSVQTVFG
jgi:hypothetical protein